MPEDFQVMNLYERYFDLPLDHIVFFGAVVHGLIAHGSVVVHFNIEFVVCSTLIYLHGILTFWDKSMVIA